jgi:hypothetical protein
VTVERDGSDIVVTNRNLLKYRDEYSKKSGHSPDNVRPRTEGEGEGDKEAKKEQKKPSPRKSASLFFIPNGVPLQPWDNPALVKQNKGEGLVKQKSTPSSSTSVKKRVPSVGLPDWLPESLWFEFEDMRKRKRAPMTDPIRFRIIKQLEGYKEGGFDPLASLEKSIRCSYVDVYEPKNGGNGNGKSNGRHSQSAEDVLRELGAQAGPDSASGQDSARTARQAGESHDDETVGTTTPALQW